MSNALCYGGINGRFVLLNSVKNDSLCKRVVWSNCQNAVCVFLTFKSQLANCKIIFCYFDFKSQAENCSIPLILVTFN